MYKTCNGLQSQIQIVNVRGTYRSGIWERHRETQLYPWEFLKLVDRYTGVPFNILTFFMPIFHLKQIRLTFRTS